MSGRSDEETSFVCTWKSREIVLRGKAFFRGKTKTWSSELAYARVKYDPEKDKIVFRRRWPQRSKDGSPDWVHPTFPKKTRKLFLQ